jgi:hypothetical protein
LRKKELRDTYLFPSLPLFALISLLFHTALARGRKREEERDEEMKRDEEK